jgi:hypothetical protein
VYATPTPPPTVDANANLGQINVVANGAQSTKKAVDTSGSTPRQFACVTATGSGVATVAVGDPCGVAGRVCPVVAGGGVVTVQVMNASELAQTIVVRCGGVPVVDSAVMVAAFAEFSRRVPVVVIGAAPAGGGQSLVNVEALFWLETAAEVDLGSVVLLGQSVRLLASVRSVQWSFGDDTTGMSVGAGRPFVGSDFCDTKQCPGWFGHTYTQTAAWVTIAATATWVGRYSVNGGPFQVITGTVTAAPSTIRLRVVQSRTVLIPNPTST